MSSKRSQTTWTIVFTAYYLVAFGMDAIGRGNILPQASELFGALGFGWKEGVGPKLSTLLLFAMLAVLIGLIADALRRGWPSFYEHDLSTLKQAVVRVIGYGGLAVIGVGLYGSKLSYVSIYSPLGFFLSCSVALIFANVLLLLNDLFEAVYVNFFRGVR